MVPSIFIECLGDVCTQKVPHVNKVLLFFMEVIKQPTALNSITNIQTLDVYKKRICSATTLNMSHNNRDTMKDY
jgi:hypothetical protein